MVYNLGALFPFPSRHFFKQNQLNVLSIYIVVLGQIDEKAAQLNTITSLLAMLGKQQGSFVRISTT